MTLGILDWGIGGCGLHQIMRHKSNYNIIYLSDAGYTPYGKVPEEELIERVQKAIFFLRKQGADHVAIACNAAGTVVKNDTKTTSIIHSGQHIIAHLSSSESIGVIGGERLVLSGKYGKKTFPKHIIHQRIAQPLSAIIESGKTHYKETDALLKDILNPIKNVDHLILSCTHYIAAIDLIKSHLSPHSIIHDPVVNMSKTILENNTIKPNNKPSDIWYTTGDKNAMVRSAKIAFNVDIRGVKTIKL